MNRDWRRLTKQAVQWTTVIVTIVVLVRIGRKHGNDLQDLDLNFNFFWLVNAAIAVVVANLMLPLGWRSLISSFGKTVAAGRAVRLWCLAQTARYLPTGLVAVVSRVHLAQKEGLSRSLTIASVAIETAALLCWSIVFCAIFVPSTTFPDAMRWVAGTASAAALLAAPWLLSQGSNQLSRLVKLDIASPNPNQLLKALTVLGTSVAVRGAGTVCLAAGFLRIDSSDVPLLIGATYASVVAGMVGITPAGLGVREGVMTAILATRFGLADAAAFALFVRAWEFAFEMLFLAGASWWGRSRRLPRDSGGDLSDTKGKM